MVFEEEGVYIDKNQEYYVGYSNVNDATGLVAATNIEIPWYLPQANPPGFRSFQSGAGMIMISSPALRGAGYEYARWDAIANTPMIRAIVSKDKTPPQSIRAPKEINFNLDVYPNPAADYINVSCLLKKNATVTIEIRDILGRIVKTQNTQATAGSVNVQRINVSELKAGTYVCVLTVDGVKQSKVFVVAK